MTKEGEWKIIYDGKGGIKGVQSLSLDEPLKTGGFDEKYKSFEKKKKYSEWKFIYEPKKDKTS